jgi:hypothetical protein
MIAANTAVAMKNLLVIQAGMLVSNFILTAQ